MKVKLVSGLSLALSLVLFTGCSNDEPPQKESTSHKTEDHAKETQQEKDQSKKNDDNKTSNQNKPSDETKNNGGKVSQDPEPKDGQEPAKNDPTEPSQDTKKPKPETKNNDSISVVAHPESIPVLVNKRSKLPEDYKPADLVYPDVPFIFSEKIEKRMMRKQAAGALEQMFDAAKKDGINLTGVSAYRSHETQTSLFNNYAKRDGYEKARTYSALPGTSEHETGLAIDVAGDGGKCPAQDCFGDTAEAKWLAKNAPDFGFIIRYPEGKENITGYKYEPWHIRYVGKSVSKKIVAKNGTLEEYFNAVPVTNGE